MIEAEKAKAEQDAANKAEAKKLQEDMEGDPDEDEEDLTPGTPTTPIPTPGPSKKRPTAAAEDDTPQRPKKLPRVSPRRSMLTKVVKHNIKDKRQLNFDLRFCRYMVGSSLAPENLELLVYLHENMRKVKMTYDSELLKAPAKEPAQPEAD